VWAAKSQNANTQQRARQVVEEFQFEEVEGMYLFKCPLRKPLLDPRRPPMGSTGKAFGARFGGSKTHHNYVNRFNFPQCNRSALRSPNSLDIERRTKANFLRRRFSTSFQPRRFRPFPPTLPSSTHLRWLGSGSHLRWLGSGSHLRWLGSGSGSRKPRSRGPRPCAFAPLHLALTWKDKAPSTKANEKCIARPVAVDHSIVRPDSFSNPSPILPTRTTPPPTPLPAFAHAAGAAPAA
jgi:hypothetical protein